MSAQSIAKAVLEKPAYCLRCKARDRSLGLWNVRPKKQKTRTECERKEDGTRP